MQSKIVAVMAGLLPALSAQAEVSAELMALQQQWAHAKYELPKTEQEAAFAALSEQAMRYAAANPASAEAQIWQGMILASQASARGGLSALTLVEQARDTLLRVEKTKDGASNPGTYSTLGSIYYQVPDWPVSFGDDDKAQHYLEKALALAPDALDTNFWYGAFLMDQKHYAKAKRYLEKAKTAPPRPHRAIADEGRRREIDALLASLADKLN